MTIVTIRKLIYVTSLLMLVGFYFFHAAVNKSNTPPLDKLYPANAFTLTNQENEPFHSDDLLGKVWVADLFFTSCPSICPLMTANMQQIQLAFPQEKNLNFVSITVDPTTDTPDQMKQYAKNYKADLWRWHFLTGPIEKINKITVDSFKLGTFDNPELHSGKFVLIDQEGWIRNYYDGTNQNEILRCIEDINKLLKN